MARQEAAIIGSGTLPYTRQILAPDQRGSQTNGEGVRIGTQVMIANPEDMVAVDAFATSGVTVGTTPVEIVGPLNNPLPRCREITIQNTGSNAVFLSHRPTFPDIDSFQLAAGGTAGASRRVTIPLLHNASVYAKTSTGTSVVRLLIL